MPRVNRNVCEWNGNTFNSAFEMDFAKHLTKIGLDWEYEPDSFVWYPKPCTYTPDFKINLPNGKSFYIETKGFFYKAARDKMERVHEMHPDIDIRYVFMKATNKLSAKAKKRPTTYAMWCEKRGLKWSEKEFPIEWRSTKEEKVEKSKSKKRKRNKAVPKHSAA